MLVTRTLHWLLCVALGGALVHLVALVTLPYVVMGRLIIEQTREAGENVFEHSALPTAAWRERVRPSPDIAYSTAVFDVRERPLRVVVPVTEPYTSLAGFSLNTDNFFVATDRSAGGETIDLVLVGPSTPRAGLAGLRLVEAPSDLGLLMVRRVVPSDVAFASIDGTRRQARVEIR